MTYAYLNGSFLPLEEASVSVMDRGFLFGDGVYEVIPVYGKRLFRLAHHLKRLQNSLDAIRICNPLPNDEWESILSGLVERNPGNDQAIYLQVTRGVAARRDHAFPEDTSPTVFAMSTPALPSAEIACTGIICLPSGNAKRNVKVPSGRSLTSLPCIVTLASGSVAP